MDWGSVDWGAVGVGVVGVAFGLYQGLRALASDQRKQHEENERQRKSLQRQLRRAFRFGDLMDAYWSRRGMHDRRHNADEHPLGEGMHIHEELPDELADGIRAFVEGGEDE